MIVIKLMTDGIIRGSGAMVYFVVATVPDLILRIGFALVLTKALEAPESGWHGHWLDRSDHINIDLYRKLGYKNDKSSNFDMDGV